jgi:hypothetical protein
MPNHAHQPFFLPDWLGYLIFLAVLAGCLPATGLVAQQAARSQVLSETLLADAAAFVADYEKQLGTVIAEERYDQEVIRTSVDELNRTGRLQDRLERRLVSDYLMLRVTGSAEHWLGFRNVLKVDGVTVPDRNQRLEEIFGMPAWKVAEQARRFADDSARFTSAALTGTSICQRGRSR